MPTSPLPPTKTGCDMSVTKRLAHAVIIDTEFADPERMADLCEDIDAVPTYTVQDRAYLFRRMARLQTQRLSA